ncbi:MAG: hypothetical protein HY699_19640 [Deltaproteobacteria bacterium]|nr:hypothetical protein [Deltaproteobacteria bacterium]
MRTTVLDGFLSNTISCAGNFNASAGGGKGVLTLPGGTRTVSADAGSSTETLVSVSTADAAVPAAVDLASVSRAIAGCSVGGTTMVFPSPAGVVVQSNVTTGEVSGQNTTLDDTQGTHVGNMDPGGVGTTQATPDGFLLRSDCGSDPTTCQVIVFVATGSGPYSGASAAGFAVDQTLAVTSTEGAATNGFVPPAPTLTATSPIQTATRKPPPATRTPTPTFPPCVLDGVLGRGEQCDDGNAVNGDGCDNNCRYELIPGNGARSSVTDQRACLLEWSVVNPNNVPALDSRGRPNSTQKCRNGDATCDFGADPNACEFRVVVCLNNVDPRLSACPQLGVADPVRVLSPHALRDAANNASLNAALRNLRDFASDNSGLSLPVEAAQTGLCSAPFAVRVPVRSPVGRVALATLTRSFENSPRWLTDVDRLTLVCTP